MQSIFIVLFLVNPTLAIISGIFMARMTSNHTILIISSLIVVAVCFFISWVFGIDSVEITSFYVVYVCLHIAFYFITYLLKRTGQG
ncbi:purine-cytosine permease-like protein [Desmospora profundinema]|uniref:Purine-cytosine permease-like protein n=1 Tax=Desmospora profundinema TaxID=1571184 RepID=A0ABU1IHF6_9BACL|nr:purine-cytosine permease-like protein [Desmospora profundinema]